MWHAFKKHDGKVVVASSMELKAKDISWMGGEERSDGVGIFVAKKLVGSVASVEKHHKRVLIFKMVLDSGLLNVLIVCTPHSRKPEEEKDNFWNEVILFVSCVPLNEMVVLDGDMNGHVGSSNVGYDGTYGGFGYVDRNGDGSVALAPEPGIVVSLLTTPFVPLHTACACEP